MMTNSRVHSATAAIMGLLTSAISYNPDLWSSLSSNTDSTFTQNWPHENFNRLPSALIECAGPCYWSLKLEVRKQTECVSFLF